MMVVLASGSVVSVSCKPSDGGRETAAAPAEASGQAHLAAASQPSQSPGGTSGAGPASRPSPHGMIAAGSAGAPFSGLIRLEEGLKPEDVKRTDVLFVMARESQGNGLAGRLVAVKRLADVEFPVRYEISAADLMIPGLPFAGPFVVTARLDRDGDPMTRGEDDLYATYPDEVQVAQEGVHMTLKKGAPKTIDAPPGVRAPGSSAGAHAPSTQPAGGTGATSPTGSSR